MTNTKELVGCLFTVPREQLQLCQNTTAERLGVDFADVYRWENGFAKPSHLTAWQTEQPCESNHGPAFYDRAGKMSHEHSDPFGLRITDRQKVVGTRFRFGNRSAKINAEIVERVQLPTTIFLPARTNFGFSR